ncbi:uncharacterized protein LOC130362872 [Hyla sarda]|uniref:uncharacterized protein LOC130362872 n=1 Tax=Hyla sarda TaxID=327740 RepID=UPI0024C3A106|nr:uncharacterized protein LOC130362872 [Hyla sarda]
MGSREVRGMNAGNIAWLQRPENAGQTIRRERLRSDQRRRAERMQARADLQRGRPLGGRDRGRPLVRPPPAEGNHEREWPPQIPADRPSRRETIQNLPRRPARPEEMCAICLAEYEEGEVVTVITCEHQFHHPCIARWLLTKSHCPLCRERCFPRRR